MQLHNEQGKFVMAPLAAGAAAFDRRDEAAGLQKTDVIEVSKSQ